MNTPTIRHERMSDIFQKFHIENLSVDAVIHRFSQPDEGYPHDHPFSFRSFIISGGYIERVWRKNTFDVWYRKDIERKPGTSHLVKASDIHKIISLPNGPCETLILPGPWERKSGFWQFDGYGAKFREWDQEEFKRV